MVGVGWFEQDFCDRQQQALQKKKSRTPLRREKGEIDDLPSNALCKDYTLSMKRKKKKKRKKEKKK